MAVNVQMSPAGILRRPPIEESTAGRLDETVRRNLSLLSLGLALATAFAWAAIVALADAELAAISILPWLVVAGGFALAEAVIVHLPFRRKAHTFSMSEVPLAVALVVISPLALISAQVIGAGVAMYLWRRQPLTKVIFNVIQFAFTSTVAWAAVRLLVGTPDAGNLADLGAVLGAVVFASLLQTLIVTTALRLVGERISREVVSQATMFSLLSAAGNGALAVVALHLVHETSWAVALIVAVPVGLLLAAYAIGWREREQAKGLDFLYGMARELQSAATVDEVAERLLPTARGHLRAGTVELLLWGAGSDRSRIAWVAEAGNDETTQTAGNPGVDLLRHKLDLHGAMIQAKGGSSDMAAYLDLREFPDAIAVPLGAPGASIGVVLAAGREGQIDSFTHEDLVVLDGLASTVNAQLERLRLDSTLDEVVSLRSRNDALARLDTVTGLTRREGLEEQIDASDSARAVIAIRVGGVEDVRDALGAERARVLVAAIASRLRRTVRGSDVVARVETTTFSVLAPVRDDVEVVDGLIRMIRTALSAPYQIEGQDIVVSVHLGVSIDMQAARAGQELIAEASAAAREAVGRTDDAYVTFHEELRGAAARRTTLAAALHDAARTGEGIAALYQPIVDVGTGKVVGIEALARWTHAALGPISPAEFLPVAQRIGVMPELGQALLRRALDDASAWRVDGDLIGLTINLSAEQLRDPATTATMEQLLEEHHVDRRRLTIDLDASTITHGLDELRSPIEAMSRLGVNIALDDFSVGADVADVLAQLPVDVIKIPGSLVGAGKDRPIDGVLRALLDLGRDLGVGIVVEGLEQAEQLQSLQALGGAMAQGYLVAPPLEAAAVGTLLLALGNRLPEEASNVIHLHQDSVG